MIVPKVAKGQVWRHAATNLRCEVMDIVSLIGDESIFLLGEDHYTRRVENSEELRKLFCYEAPMDAEPGQWWSSPSGDSYLLKCEEGANQWRFEGGSNGQTVAILRKEVFFTQDGKTALNGWMRAEAPVLPRLERFTYDEAKAKAEAEGGRLPTKEETDVNMMVPKIAKGQKWRDALTGDCCEVVAADLIGIILRGPDYRLRMLGEEQLREAYVYQIPVCTERLTYDDAKTKAEAEGGQLPSAEYGRPELPKPRCHAPCQVWRHVGPSYIEEAIVVSVKYPSGAGPAEATLHVYHNGIFVFTVRRWDDYFVGGFVGYVDPGGQPFEKTRLGDAWRYGRPRPTREEAAEKNFKGFTDDGAREVYPGEVKYDIKSAYPDPDALIRALILEEAKTPPPFVGKDAWLSFLSDEYERTRNEKRARGRGVTGDDAKFIALRIKSWREGSPKSTGLEDLQKTKHPRGWWDR